MGPCTDIPLAAEPVELVGRLRGDADTTLRPEGRALLVEGGPVHALTDPNATKRILLDTPRGTGPAPQLSRSRPTARTRRYG